MRERFTCVIIGGGGHARVLVDALREGGSPHRLAAVDRDCAQWENTLLDVPIVGGDERIAELRAGGVTHFVIGLGGTSDNAPRSRLFTGARAAGLTPLTVVHPRAIVSRWAQLAPGAQILAGAIVNAGAVLGANAIVNSGAIVEHDCRIGDHAHIASGARLAGGVTVGSGAHVGLGANVRQGISIGSEAVVGAGAVVLADVAPAAVVAGVPAKPLTGHRLAARA